MLDFVTGFILVAIGCILGHITGWMDGRKSRDSQRAATPIKPEAKDEFCQDYSHLKKKL
jgi:hypothetical protein